MEDINMNSLNDALIGVDKNKTATAFYVRDKLMNINNNTQIINSLKKLGYYNIDMMFESKKYILDNISQLIVIELNNNWDSNIKYKTIDSIINQIKESQNYKVFENILHTKVGRSMILSKFISYHDTYEFYNTLTLEELAYLGY